MKLDWDVVRRVLTAVEEMETETRANELDTPGIDPHRTAFHVTLLQEAGHLKVIDCRHMGDQHSWIVQRMTMDGYALLEQLRQPRHWEMIKKIAAEKGVGLTIDSVSALSKHAMAALIG